ncbi:DUF2860 domain-containing protein [Photobacterium gaetbulicola]|uniref:DUF2860 domain-containing protein n=1 Tax=Photobacterium gaetbulicola TaxID=1295392 RepID=UPI00068BA6DD|nr:DUF2860 domain-containing protein [Photobacterium gaetbulicola]
MTRPILPLAITTVFISNAYAIEPIPKKSGFSGFVNIGAGGVSVESNNLAKFGSVDLSNNTLRSINTKPDSEESALPVIAAELAYTFANSRTQIFIGNQLEDYIRFDFSTLAGIRQEIGKAGILGASFLYTPLATEVWADPFLTGIPRTKTDRSANGYRLIWDRMYGTGLELRYSYRDVDIDDERSGVSLGLDNQEQALLNRNGDVHRFTVQYTFTWDSPRHRLVPSFSVIDHQSDGDAMAYDAYSLGANYIYSINRWRLVTNVYLSELSFDEVHPVYDRKIDSSQLGASFTAFYASPFGWKNWLASGTVAWFEDDSDVDFYDASVSLFSVGLLYRF